MAATNGTNGDILEKQRTLKGYKKDTLDCIIKGPVIRATFFFNLQRNLQLNLQRNIVALQVVAICCSYYFTLMQITVIILLR